MITDDQLNSLAKIGKDSDIRINPERMAEMAVELIKARAHIITLEQLLEESVKLCEFSLPPELMALAVRGKIIHVTEWDTQAKEMLDAELCNREAK